MDWLKSLPGWVWIVLAIVLVGSHIDRRLQRIEDFISDLHEHFLGDDHHGSA